MADPLSVGAATAGFISLGIKVTESLVRYYVSYKNQDTEVAGTVDTLEALLDTLHLLQITLQTRQFRSDEQYLIFNIESAVQNCEELIEELQEECKKLQTPSTSGIKAGIRAAGRRAVYPFRQSTLQKLDEDVAEIRQNLSLALDVLQMKDNKYMHDDVSDIKSLVELVRASQISSDLRNWLQAPDATINHNAACLKRHPRTGDWLVQGPAFSQWLTDNESFLWLNGFAGCGKSILCSTAIQHTFRQKRSNPKMGIAFFYFTFNDESKQDECAMLRTLIMQLSGQQTDSLVTLDRLRGCSNGGLPPTMALKAHLRSLIQRFEHVYILLDALDESPSGRRRDQVLNAIQDIRNWHLPGLHLLVTSRDESDIRDWLDPRTGQEIPMKNVGVDQDISNFISAHLESDRRLSKWAITQRDRIREALSERAHGVFRWVECQFESLKRCPRSEGHLDDCLQSLPRTLDETYERMLCNIDGSLAQDAQRILTMLCFSSRPLLVQELIDGVAVDLGHPSGLNLRRRLHSVDDLHKICPGLIDVSLIFPVYHDQYMHRERLNADGSFTVVRIAHFSVQEYFESDRIKQQKAAAFALRSAKAHNEIAQVCLVYLLEPSLSSREQEKTAVRYFPLADFAAKYWHYHYKHADDQTSILDDLALRLMQPCQDQESFRMWIKLHNPDISGISGYSSIQAEKIGSPLYYTSLLGFTNLVRKQLGSHQNDIAQVAVLVNAEGGAHGNALSAAAFSGHTELVKMLIENGADVNAHEGDWSNPLAAAAFRNHRDIVELLLESGAQVNSQGGRQRSALAAAAAGGYEELVKLMINRGADIDAQGPEGNALFYASQRDHTGIVELLIRKGANVNLCGPDGTALAAASRGGLKKIVVRLIENGADVNAPGPAGTALIEASVWGNKEVVQLLIDSGADVNVLGPYGTALKRASVWGKEEVVQLLIDSGADVNILGPYGTALSVAAKAADPAVVQLLIDSGADVNARGPSGSALYAAEMARRAERTERTERAEWTNDRYPRFSAERNERYMEVESILQSHGALSKGPDDD